ncbi:Ceropsin [Thelohanellus kitauei]|uniref:Ceropsin n=1 Tax=Thelohanellus kitauei TaxID=669202 RepID=A0A0C2MTK5_THEKT|nr:Ceropsin [Thelohanellus kitauei]
MENECKPPSRIPRRIAFTVCLLIVIVSVISNIALSVAIWTDRNLRMRFNILLLLFCISNGVLSIVSTLELVSIMNGTWVTGSLGCKIYAFSSELLIAFSVCIVLMMCFDRYQLIFKGFDYKSTNLGILNICLCFLVVTVVTIPHLFISGISQWDCNKIKCVFPSSESGNVDSITWKMYYITKSVLLIIVPIISISVLYAKIIMAFRSKKQTGSYQTEHTVRQPKDSHFLDVNQNTASEPSTNRNTIVSNRCVVVKQTPRFTRGLVISIMLITAFIVLLTPFLALRMVQLFQKNVPHPVKAVTKLLFLLYLTVYPMIYAWMTPDVQKRLKTVFCTC